MHRGWFNTVIDLFFPPHEEVIRARTIPESKILPLIKLRYDSSFRIYTALLYGEEKIRLLIRANKYYNDTHARELLGKVFNEILPAILEEKVLDDSWREYIVIPIPSSRQRIQDYGFNQVESILKTLPQQYWGTHIQPDLLKKKNRKSQTHVSKTERAENVRGAFYVPRSKQTRITNKNIILIDDVSETGSTIKDAARALKDAGAREVIGVALAK